MEVLIYNAINSTEIGLGPAKAFRRVLEVIASGVLLPGNGDTFCCCLIDL